MAFHISGRAILLALACVAGLPSIASAQSVIAGQVKDESGAVLPGVSVEVASPALIEKVRTVSTDASGQFKVVDLRPGVYTVTFSLSGFTSVTRSGVDLPSSFTATVDADMKVGALEESVTVSAATSTVDVQQATRTLVLTRELVDQLPTPRNIMSVGQLVPGMRQSVPDVGGSRLMEQSNIFGHGANFKNTSYLLDGLLINGNKLDGQVIQYQNDALNSEVVITTSALPADIGAAGAVVNSIPKDGGNIFSGSGFMGYTNGKWMSTNVNDALRTRGIRTGNNISQIDNFQVSVGGPILRDRLWFFSAAGHTKADENVANTPDPLILADGTEFDTTNNQWVNNLLVRLTLKASRRDKLSVFFQRTFKKKGATFAFGTDPYWSSNHRDEPRALIAIGQTKWTSTVTSRLLLDAGFSYNLFQYQETMWPWAEQPKYLPAGTINPAWIANAPSTDTALNKNSKCTLPDGCTRWGSWGLKDEQKPRRNVAASSATYVPGSHSLKTGFTVSWGPYAQQNDRQADLAQNYVNGQPQTVTVYNTPIDVVEYLDYDLALYVKDSWTIKRLTLNPGFRVEYFSSSIKESGLPAGRFRPAITFPAQENVPPHWKNDFTPRFSAAYDLAGDGKTALKVGVSKYYQAYTTSFASQFSPAESANETRNWFDADLTPGTSTRSGLVLATNGDGIAQDNEIGPSGNPNFGIKGADRTYDPNIKKIHSWEYMATVQRQLFSGMSAGFGYFHRSYRNIIITDRTLIALSDYTSFTVPVPSVSNDPDVAAVIDPNEVLTVYNLNTAKRSVFNSALLDQNSSGNLGAEGPNQSIYDGFEASFTARLGAGRSVYGGWTMERNVSVFCDNDDNPNGVTLADLYTMALASNGGRFCDQRKFDIPFRHELKLAGITTLPYKFGFAAALQSYAGLPRTITWQPAAGLFPGGRTNAETIILNKPGSLYYPRYNQLDINFKRTFKARNAEITGQFDLFNALNAGAILAENNAVGASLGQVQTILQARMPRVVFQVKW